MPVERPTFSESWYRVADLRVRLRTTVQSTRQHYRGQTWIVLRDPSNEQFFRLNQPAYHLVGLLDGRRTVAQAWADASRRLGDDAPTQPEVIQLLGQLYSSNLLQGDLPPDAEGLFQRFRKRRRKEVQGYLTNLLFVRFPLFDPDRLLDRWVPIVGKLFTWPAMVAWLVLVAIGISTVAGRTTALFSRASQKIAPGNLPLLYAAMVLAKVLHEFGHAFACKAYGRRSGSGGEVHTMGIMLLVFVPLPYVDASSAWSLRNKWHRVVVGAAGVLVELALASVAAMVWAATAEGTTIHALAYNVMFIASVSTVLFNGNPLLRYDGYYILSDLLEIANLWSRSREQLQYLVKRYVYGVRRPRSPAHTPGERVWLPVYGLASIAYRVVICLAIFLFVADRLFFIGVLLAVAAVFSWVVVPFGKFVHYLLSSPELVRTRGRAMAATGAFFALVIAGLGLLPVPDRCRVEGVVEPLQMAVVRAGADGFVTKVSLSGGAVTPDGEPLVRASNPSLVAQLAQLRSQRRQADLQLHVAGLHERAVAQALREQIGAIDSQVGRVESQLDALTVRAPLAGTWIAPGIEQLEGAYVRRGTPIGAVADLTHVQIRATAGQTIAGLLTAGDEVTAEIRVRGRPDMHLAGLVTAVLPAGQSKLPSPALGYAAGGSVATAPDDPHGLQSTEPFFEVRLAPEPDSGVRLLPGQRVVVRFSLSPKPVAVQCWRWLLQTIQKRFES